MQLQHLITEIKNLSIANKTKRLYSWQFRTNARTQTKATDHEFKQFFLILWLLGVIRNRRQLII